MGAGDLAELLRELKERSGLSYGALAKRLHVSTSTLHRYVSGSAVPTEFAPLERFARVCGASRQEMVEVHRRWILADASRGERDRDRDRKDPEPSPGEASGDAAGPSRGGAVSGGLASGGAASGAPAAGGVNPGAPARGESAAADPGAGDPRNGGSQGTDSRDGGLREPNPGDEGPHNESPHNGDPRDGSSRNETSPGADPKDEAPGIVIGSAPAAARREGRRLPRARVLVAAGVVLALGATAVAVQAASGGGDSNQVSTDSPSADDGKREGGPDGPGSASPSAKESGKGKPDKEAKPSGEPDGEGEGKGKGKGEGSGDEPSAPAAGGGGEGGGAGGAAPVTVSTQAHYWQDPCGHPYLVDKEPGALSPPPNEQDAPGWASANGAVSARDQTVKLVVQGKGDDTVVLESLNVRVAGTGAPLAWNNYKMGYLGVGCGGNVPKHTFDVNLDASVPRPAPQSGDDNFPYKVSASDPEAFYVEATANTRYVRWYLELEWSSGGRSGTVRIDDTGKPFATSGDKSRPVYGYSLDTKKWTKTNRDNDNVPEPAA
ncbi:helix-turn-helix domain-containing protein [Streptomyces sp. NPDC046925]|uniref:transcriptional regulator n=1 Tax=Streptomyces sp. NPDC046925 TaxID=3155375 RepID=UPI0033CA6EA8